MIIRLRRYVGRITHPDGDPVPTVINELVLDKRLRVHAIPRTGEYVGYDRYEGGKVFMVKSVEHAIGMDLRETVHDVIVVLA